MSEVDERPTVSLSDAERRERRWMAGMSIWAAVFIVAAVLDTSPWIGWPVVGMLWLSLDRVSHWRGYAKGRRAAATDAYRRQMEGRL